MIRGPAPLTRSQQLPGLSPGELQRLPGAHDLWPDLFISRHNPSPSSSIAPQATLAGDRGEIDNRGSEVPPARDEGLERSAVTVRPLTRTARAAGDARLTSHAFRMPGGTRQEVLPSGWVGADVTRSAKPARSAIQPLNLPRQRHRGYYAGHGWVMQTWPTARSARPGMPGSGEMKMIFCHYAASSASPWRASTTWPAPRSWRSPAPSAV